MQPGDVFPRWTGHVRMQVWRKIDGLYQLVQEVEGYNARTDAGAQAVANAISGTQPAVFKYIAFTATNVTIAKGDTTLAGEITTGGLGRTVGTFAYTTTPSTLNGAMAFTITTANTTSASYTIRTVGLFNAASSGTLLSEFNFGADITGISGDVINTVWTIGA